MHKADLVDFHAHILPRADHGSSSVKETAKQLEYAKNAGVTRIVVTPHFYPHVHTAESFLNRRKNAYSLLKDSGILTADMPDVRLGAEVLLCENLHKMSGLSDLCVYGTNTLLLELPFSEISQEHYDTVCKIIESGFNVVLAHADRYRRNDIEKFISVGASIQLNASALTEIFKKKHIFEWLENNFVVALGSDIHRTDKKAYKRFILAKKKLGNKLSYLCEKSNLIWEDSQEYIL